MGVLVALGWFGALGARAGRLHVLRHSRGLVLASILFAVWLTVSTAWAERPSVAGSEAGYWWLAVLALLIAMTMLGTTREVGLLALAFVAGAVGSAMIGLASGGLYTGNQVGQTAIQGRLTGGGGDPNLQAAAYVAAMFLAMGLMSVYRRRAHRFGLVLAFILVTVAFFATQSRGGLIALAFATMAALLVSPGQRRRILALVAVAAIIAAVAVAIRPDALQRITNFGGGSSGRSDIWNVATTIFDGHPIAGIGLAQFEVAEPRYALRPGEVTRVRYLAEKPDPVHNTYLQLLAETGVIGLAGYLAVIAASLRASWLAARRFELAGRPGYADLARASLMGTTGMLAAIFFITDGNDWRLWLLLGLGPALLALARQLPLQRPQPATGLEDATL
jgi:O-antigen ligase